ncbi:Diacylglycerol kinase theta [Trichinella pseudospiralis]|uniref:Diacylglycerol kinase n=1 Tax=Trichinella pseudospiralis TaxID=6337 RepID=A0A0V1FN10_TRIPS|nr:Diacylglycerol kinase theta [Trichinella pseudospiralis]
MAVEGHNLEPQLLQMIEEYVDCNSGEVIGARGRGHFFVKKNFGKPIHCHHCCDLFWGILSQGYICETCNFICHEKCLKTVASFCSGIAMQLIKNPVAHCWSEPGFVKRKFCLVCRKKTDDVESVECEVCDYYVHVDCLDLAVSDCREASTFISSLEPTTQRQHHHWREGNLNPGSKCTVCRKSCWSSECLAGMRCQWCNRTAHAICYRQIVTDCDFGPLRPIMLPPNCLTIPRAELPMELLLSIKRREKEVPISPSKNSEDFSSSLPEDPNREKDDNEILRVYDGNVSYENNVFRTCSVPRSASLDQILEAILRSFHIYDNPAYYMLTSIKEVDDRIVEYPLDRVEPLKGIRNLQNGRLSLFLRYNNPNCDEAITLKVYGGWLRIPITFCTVTINPTTTTDEVISEALSQVGMPSLSSSMYNLVEVELSRGVVEKTLDPQEPVMPLLLAQQRNSLKRYLSTRYYLQEKEDPHGSTVSLFVANLPPTLTQKQYEKILLRLLETETRPFSAIGPIYFEYGSLVMTFNSPKVATKVCLKLQDVSYEERKLLVLCLPNIQAHMIPADVEPLVVLVNMRSGGCQGADLIRSFRKLLNPFQVFDVMNGGPLVALYVFRNVPKYKILVCGGDGTAGWVLQCLDIVGQDSVCSSPPCALLPLGTGNDLARVLRWGSGYTGQEDPLQILKDIIEADEVRLDRWTVVFHPQEPSSELSCALEQNPDRALPMNNPEEQTSMIIMNNYFGIGLDAEVCLGFDKARKLNPDKFNSRIHNKGVYARIGLKKMVNRKLCRDIQRKIKLEVDGRVFELPSLEGIIILNIMSWGSGSNPWGPEKEEVGFTKPNHDDGLLEVIGITGIVHLGQMQAGFSSGIRLAQGGHVKITTFTDMPVHVDGEPQMLPPGTFTILKSALKATMLKKSKNKRRQTTDANATTSTMTTTLQRESSSQAASLPSSLSSGPVLQAEPDDDYFLPLAYKTYFGRHDSSKGSLIILHGLFGHKGNWRSLGAALSQKLNRKVFAVDLRNHGDSPHHSSMTVPEMADDVIALIKDLNIAGDQLGIIGHSMGGKVAAHLALHQPSLLGKLLLEDMIPKRIDQPQDKVLLCIKALNQCELPQMDLTKARQTVYQQLFSVIKDAETTHFLLTSLMLDKHGKPVWKFNISAIENNLQEMFFYEIESKNTFEGPTFVVHGKRSDYVKPADVPFMLNFFPKLRFQCIAEAGHWVHADRPSEFLSAAVDFFRR